VALNTLLRTVDFDSNAVQRHRATVLDCLKDQDASIKRRAMELAFALTNAQNFRTMSAELIAFLADAEPEFKTQCSSAMVASAERYQLRSFHFIPYNDGSTCYIMMGQCVMVNVLYNDYDGQLRLYRYAPNRRVHVDTLFDVLKTAGNYVREDVIFSTIQLVSAEATDLHPYIVREAWQAIRQTENCSDKQPLTQVSCWCIGEYGAHLLDGAAVDGQTMTVDEDEVIQVYKKILFANHISLVTKQYGLVSLTKLSTRFPNSTPRIQEIIDAFGSHLQVILNE
jgi:AP-1 complex subunit gamma-1